MRRSRPTARPCRRHPTTRTTRSRCSVRCSRRRAPISSRPTSSSSRISSKRRSANTGWRASTTRAIVWRRRRSPSSIGRSASASRRRGRCRRLRQLRERARAASAEPILNPASREPLNLRFNNVSLRDILGVIGSSTGINISYDREVQDRAATVQLDGVTLEQALNQIMTMNQLSYKVLSDRSIFVFPDTPPKHAQYDEQVVRTFYLSHADATEVLADSQHDHPPARHRRPAGDCAEQDRQYADRPRHQLRRPDSRADHRAERQAARRDRRRRRDPRGRPDADEELRPQPVRVRRRRRVLAGRRAGRRPARRHRRRRRRRPAPTTPTTGAAHGDRRRRAA